MDRFWLLNLFVAANCSFTAGAVADKVCVAGAWTLIVAAIVNLLVCVSMLIRRRVEAAWERQRLAELLEDMEAARH